MINKQGIWFLTLFSLILVLSIYYITMPDEMFISNNDNVVDNTVKEKDEVTKDVILEKTDGSYISTLKIELADKREETIRNLEETMNTSDSSEEKNKAYETIKMIDNYKSIEDSITKAIDKEYNFDSYVEVANDKVNIIVEKDKHDVTLANDLMRIAQNEFDSPMNITVKFC